ncbi:ComEA family DNA-binding protein [Microbacterium thalli]|uniref:Helix-hairpin-helix domain-containing protein n=1 Tax=Microbacterium thalli TaxID=3027921 RepID=A0ABT5SJ55_9MICO|nr:helix-hairpin-helix domain-containing protein [Microbacterium thalli]MDD7962817.1 helix-hairpin-helix domain-containing protein [Microbacterium thalli]
MTGRDSLAARRRLGVGAVIVLVLAAAGATVAIGMFRSVAAPVELVTPAASPGVVAEPASVYVHVHGAVANPGLYRLDVDARVVDAVAAAGGLTDGADPAGVNLARTVTDGEQLYVPAAGEAPPPTSPDESSSGGGAGGNGPVNLNTADAAALNTLPRVGPALAERIIAWREENGRFTSVEDLLAVSGIGEKMLEALRDQVTV